MPDVRRRLACVLSRLRLIGARDRLNDELAAELEAHLELLTERFIRAGMSPAGARDSAVRQMGNTTRVREDVYRMNGVAWLEAVLQDVRYAVRSLRKRPGFAAVVLLTMAVGIGANVSMFSLVNALLLQPLPYPTPDRLVHLWEVHRSDVRSRSGVSYPTFLDWRNERDLFTALEGYDETNVTVGGGGAVEFVNGARVTSGFLDILGAMPIIGTGFTARDDVPGGTRAVILSHGFWVRRFGADAGIVGHAIDIDGVPWEVRGVLPSAFHFAPGDDMDVWLPLGRTSDVRAQRFNRWVSVVGRLRQGVTLEQARLRMNHVMTALAARHPETNAGRGAIVVPLRDVIVGGATRPLLVLFGAVSVVLLIVCANVANLVLARSLERGREMAVRAALGASRGRVLCQLVMESLVLTLGGAALGACLAARAVPLLHAVLALPAVRTPSVDLPALGFTSAIAVAAGLLASLAPALRGSGRGGAESLRTDARTGSGREHRRLRDALVIAELGLTLVLLVAAGLVARSLVAVLRVDPGFVAQDVATVRVALAGPTWADGQAQQRFFEDLLARVSTLPGVSDVGAISSAPLQGTGPNVIQVDGAPEPDPGARLEVSARAVAGHYFQALRIPLLQGRTLDARDDGRAPYAVVISESLSRRLFGRRPAVGERIRFRGWEDRPWTIVGVAGDVKTDAMDRPSAPSVYYSHLQGPANRMSIVARGTDAGALARQIAGEAHAAAPGAAVYRAGAMTQYIARSPAVSSRQYVLTLLGGFAAGALLLAVMGVYGVVAYAVTQRRREVAIRIALGARREQVLALILRRGAVLAAAGVALGVTCALGVMRLLSSLLFGVGAGDLLTYVAVSLGVAGVALAASYVPARRAAATPPGDALRYE